MLNVVYYRRVVTTGECGTAFCGPAPNRPGVWSCYCYLKLLEDRWKYFMLMLMYKLSKVEEDVNRYRPETLLPTGPKVKTKVDFTYRERVY